MSTPSTPTVGQYRMNWFVVLGALSAAPIFYVVMARTIAKTITPSAALAPTRSMLHPLFMALAGVQLVVGAVVLLRARAPGDDAKGASSAVDLATPAQFQLRSIIGMAMFEAISIYGFLLAFMGNDPTECVVWSAVSLLGMLGVALPVGVAYWRDLGQQDQDQTRSRS
jgi:hypothetical protein